MARRLRYLFPLALALVLIAGLACGPSATPTPTPTSTTGGTPGTSGLPNVPRNRTLILARGGTTIQDPDNMNPYSLGGLGRIRDTLNKTIYEFLYYYNHNTGELIPWLATGFEYNNDFTQITVRLRPDVTWSDGKPFSARDIAFTLNMLKQYPTLVFSSDMQEWVKDVEVVDEHTARIILNKPNPRFFFFYMAENSEINLAILPEHIWKDQNPETFRNFDLANGWPVGTGPFKVVSATTESVIFDRRDDWWAAKTGFQKLPEVRRVLRIPGGDSTGIANLFTDNGMDFGGPLLKGTFESARARNPNLIAWNKQGPVWGTADACVYTLGLNNKVKPFDDPEVRWAINHAIDRQKMINLAYEGSTVKRVVPLSTFGGPVAYEKKIEDIIAKYNPDNFDLNKTTEILTRKGFKKGGDAFWAGPDGRKIQMTLHTPEWLRPMGPVLAQMLVDAGFDAVFKLEPTGFFEGVQAGSFESWIIVHCGSPQEPYTTLKDFTTAYSAPIGQATRYIWANSRYENPQYDAIIAKMEAMSPSPNDPAYVDLVRQAFDIWLRDLPEITLAEERHVWTFNTTYWTGWPNADDPYVAPYDVWGGFLLTILKLKPTQ